MQKRCFEPFLGNCLSYVMLKNPGPIPDVWSEKGGPPKHLWSSQDVNFGNSIIESTVLLLRCDWRSVYQD